MNLPNRLLWIDLETEGLGDKVQILEIALVITDARLDEIATFNQVVMPRGLTLDPFVLAMHTKNGLLADLQHGRPIADVDVLAAGWAHAHAAVGGPACGQSVHVDVAWLQSAGMPLLRKCFNHRVFDASTLTLADRIMSPEGAPLTPGEPVHRALADIRYSIRCAKEFMGLE